MNRKNGQVVFEGEAMLRRTFEWFKSRGVDAVALCGDMADFGLVEELETVGRVWNEVFGGTKVERLFVYGNHDWEAYQYGNRAKELFGDTRYEHSIRKDLAGAWRRAFDEEYAPVWRKEVNGYTFVGAHWIADRCREWEERGVPQAAPWFEENGRTLTKVTELDRSARIRELARLTGGELASEAMLRGAAELLDAAEAFKRGGAP